jgi:hypothetical protein
MIRKSMISFYSIKSHDFYKPVPEKPGVKNCAPISFKLEVLRVFHLPCLFFTSVYNKKLNKIFCKLTPSML